MTTRNVGITGPDGFIATHLAQTLQSQDGIDVKPCRRAAFDDPARLSEIVQQCDSIVHLAAMNRGDSDEVYQANTSLVDKLIFALDAVPTRPHVVFASSTQRDLDNPYGRSKKYGEQQLTQWARRSGAPLTVLVIPNVYGAGCKPFYNSVVATFCHQLTHGQQPTVVKDQEIDFVWVNDLVQQIIQNVEEPPDSQEVLKVDGQANISVKRLLATLEGFRDDFFHRNVVPDTTDRFTSSLYSTFLSYADLDDHCHRPQLHTDPRGELFEIIKLANGGQVFFSTTRPGVIRGNHYHTRKVEWFCVVKGEAMIRLRRLGADAIREIRVDGQQPQFVSIPPLHTHHIENVGEQDLLTMFWCNEIFDQADPDTVFEKVA